MTMHHFLHLHKWGDTIVLGFETWFYPKTVIFPEGFCKLMTPKTLQKKKWIENSSIDPKKSKHLKIKKKDDWKLLNETNSNAGDLPELRSETAIERIKTRQKAR